MGYALKKQEFVRSVTIGDLPESEYKLAEQLTLTVQYGESGVTVSEPRTGVFAYDDTLEKALIRFREELITEFKFLHDNRQTLAPPLEQELRVFEELLIPRR
jgi:hypothetical protein